MATKVKMEFISDGFRQILESQGVADVCEQAGQSIAAKAGDGFEYFPAHLNYGGGRTGGFVNATTYEAMLSEAIDKSLTRAVG